MPKNEVFANGMEVACKAADGKSVACFPDVCLSPPSLPAGPVPIPYPNTAYARDLTNATKTVFISGKPVAQKNKSYLKTSTGNEPATRSLGMGVVTHTIKGKAYFASWSMNVKVEGLNVCRHLDLMTHNHASLPGNTATWHYVDQRSIDKCGGNPFNDHACCKDIDSVDDKCKQSGSENRRFRSARERRNNRRRRDKKPLLRVRNRTWKDEHCKKMLFNLRADNLESTLKDLQTEAQEMVGDIESIAADLGWQIVGGAAQRYGVRLAAKHAAATLGCGGGGAAAGSVVPGAGTAAGAVAGASVCNVAMVVIDAADLIWTVGTTSFEISAMKDQVQELLDLANQARGDAQRILEAIEDPEKLKQLQQELADELEQEALQDPCLKARRCMLVPKSASQETRPPNDTRNRSQGQATMTDRLFADSRGCCPGQTGHHLILDAWLQSGGNRGAGDLCSGSYNEKSAPTVCVEGATQNIGTHGKIHRNTTDIAEELLAEKRPPCNIGFSMSCAIEVAAQAHRKTFGRHCNKECIVAQLEKYYDGLGCRPRAVDQNGNELTRTDGQTGTQGTF